MKTPLQRIRIGAVSLGIVFFLAVLGYHWIAGYSWMDSLWMVVITVSTVGYGERSTMTVAVQLLTIGVIVTGVSASVYTVGGLIQFALEGEVDRVLGRRRMDREISRKKGHVVVCGFGRMGQDLVSQLAHRSTEFIVIDHDSEKSELAEQLNAPLVVGDATLESVLNQAKLGTAKAIVSALPTDAENVFITLTARNLRPDIQIIAKSEQESSCRKLRQAGADKIVMPHRVGAQQMERMISRPSTADLVELIYETSELGMELDEFLISPNSSLSGCSIGESRIKEDYNLLVVGIKNETGDFRFNPPPSDVIRSQDTLLLIGQFDDINRMKSEQAI